MGADGAKAALFLFRCTEIRCSKKSVFRLWGRDVNGTKAAVRGGVVPHPAVRGWVSLGIGQISKNI